MPKAVSEVYAIFDEAVARHEGVRPVEQGRATAWWRLSAALRIRSRLRSRCSVRFTPNRGRTGWSCAYGSPSTRRRRSCATLATISGSRSRCARIRAIAPGGHTLLSHATHDLVADCLPDGVELLDCGEHRLRDLGRPERIFALVHPELHALEPALLRSLDAVPNNLPGQLSSFVGRERELEELRPALGATGC